MNGYLVPLTVAAVCVGLAALTIPRIPAVMAWTKRRDEKRILGWTGPMPAHDRITLIPGEAEVFRMITDAEYPPDEKSYRWIAAALKAGQKARKA